ncbi:hypothetical protein [Paracoccus aestuariivivens]|uniref:Uncharacterized protein n=1 Tax=Paracoccus aestuariivivens TaxID=1820333 RepID=A0A6L6JGJ9_9RHOB|nr:hypothetical protein [Paracoccus aestuariivivens]MTH79697.1 hypothetical protein [Paracoccus aestuariivivens]
MPISRISQIYEHEGMAGFYSRIRYPKARRLPQGYRSVSEDVVIIGDDLTLVPVLAEMLAHAGRDVVGWGNRDDLTRFHFDPDISGARRFDRNDVLIFSAAAQYHVGQLRIVAEECHAIIETSDARFRTISEMRIAGDRLFNAAGSPDEFRRTLYRFFVATGAIEPDLAYWRYLMPAPEGAEARFCLSLPETPERRDAFRSTGLGDFRVVDGLVMNEGWIGAALGFRSIAEACLATNVQTAMICEDDVQPAPDFASRLRVVMDYLGQTEWDVFSGLSSHVGPEYRIERIERFGGETFVHLNRTTGMVFNIYNRRALAHLANWSIARHGAASITIDRHLEEMPGLRVVTTLPFLVDHSDELSSAAWGFQNRRYRSLLTASSQRLGRLVEGAEAGSIRATI